MNGRLAHLWSKIPQLKRRKAELQRRIAGLTAELKGAEEMHERLREEARNLRSRNATLMSQLRGFGDATRFNSTPETLQRSGSPQVFVRSIRKSKFVVISNMRSGSTWVETSLGALADVAIDYELKWGAEFAPSSVHVFLDEGSSSISGILEAIDTDAPITGSKLVFDPNGMTSVDFQSLTEKIGADVRIVHLTRHYRDVFLSARRGFYHSLDPERADKIGAQMREGLKAADFGRAGTPPSHVVTPAACLRELGILLENDRRVCSLATMGFPYLQVDYTDFSRSLEEIARFIGSDASSAEIQSVLARPVVKKLPPLDGGRLVTNLERLEPIFEAFEGVRREEVLRRNGPPDTLTERDVRRDVAAQVG